MAASDKRRWGFGQYNDVEESGSTRAERDKEKPETEKLEEGAW
jgi:hypothetical protein